VSIVYSFASFPSNWMLYLCLEPHCLCAVILVSSVILKTRCSCKIVEGTSTPESFVLLRLWFCAFMVNFWGESNYSKFKGVLNPNFRPFSFELKKIRFFKINFFKINFDLGFRVLWSRTLNIFKILFPLSSLMALSAEP